MIADETSTSGLTSFSRFVLIFIVLPSLFIAGVQLFILSAQTETYFAWTFAAPISAAFLGAGYWAAMVHTVSGSRAKGWQYVRTSLPAALTATTLLTITTFLYLDKFHFASALLTTRFVTWVWIVIYVFVPPILIAAWVIQSRLPGAKVKGLDALPAWMRIWYVLLAVFTLACGVGLFLFPASMSSIWPWTVPPLAARAVSSWLCAFGVACISLSREDDIRFGAGTSSSLFAYCVLELIVIARFASAIAWSKPLAIGYLLFLILGLLITGANLLADRKLKEQSR